MPVSETLVMTLDRLTKTDVHTDEDQKTKWRYSLVGEDGIKVAIESGSKWPLVPGDVVEVRVKSKSYTKPLMED